MCKGAWKIAKVNMRNCKVAYIVAGVTALTMLVQTFIYIIIATTSGGSFDNSNLSVGNVLWLAPLLAAILIPAKNFRKIINLGGKRDNFVLGCLMIYVIFAAVGALANTLIYYSLDRFIQTSGFFNKGVFGGVMNVAEIFGWTQNGAVVAFAQQFAFLFLALSVIHTLTAMQDKWYGWATDVVIAAIIAVFTPIAALRPALLGFFNLIIFQSNAFLQIAACLILGLAVYALNKPIFARKVI